MFESFESLDTYWIPTGCLVDLLVTQCFLSAVLGQCSSWRRVTNFQTLDLDETWKSAWTFCSIIKKRCSKYYQYEIVLAMRRCLRPKLFTMLALALGHYSDILDAEPHMPHSRTLHSQGQLQLREPWELPIALLSCLHLVKVGET